MTDIWRNPVIKKDNHPKKRWKEIPFVLKTGSRRAVIRYFRNSNEVSDFIVWMNSGEFFIQERISRKLIREYEIFRIDGQTSYSW